MHSRRSSALLSFRPTTEADLDFVLAAEWHLENLPFVNQWTREQHQATLSDPDVAHMVAIAGAEARPVGYLILAGLANPHGSLELRRIVITEKGKGYGRQALRLIKQEAFERRGAHRLWLDVNPDNERARRLYESEGFVVEGVLRECFRTDQGYESLVLMSILRREYEATAM